MNASTTPRGPILVMAGGTGGHVFPGLAVANALREAGAQVCWLGTVQGIEARLVPAAGFTLHTLPVSGLRGKGITTWLLAPLRLGLSLWAALGLMLKLKPAAVLGLGGFASGPGGLMASALGRPLVIHEQNAIAGMTNRWLARVADRVLEGFPGTFAPGFKPQHTGNPVRADIAALPPPAERMSGRTGPPRLLVLGGSLGALALNRALPQALATLPADRRPEVWHQAGSRTVDAAREAYASSGVDARVDAFIDDMANAYAWADLVVCRAGALTIAELAAAGLGAVLVPYPHAVDDHQTANARFLADAGAAVLRSQAEVEVGALTALLPELLNDRARLLRMAECARAQACPRATAEVAEICLTLAGGGS